MDMKLRRYEEMLLALVRHAINGGNLPEELFKGCPADEWKRCYALACEQGVMGVAWDSVMALPAELQPERTIKLRWALAVENYSKTYRRYCKAIAELSDFYERSGIMTVQLKGVGLSSYYPVPERRQGGDIDIYTCSSDKEKMSDEQANDLADKLMRDKGVDVEMHSYKHSFFYYKGIPIENHKFFSNIEHYSSAKEAETLLHEHLNPCKVTLPGDYEIMVPSEEFNSIFIILHALQHLVNGLALHHLCDWACVMKRIGPELPLSINDSQFTRAVRAINQLCVEYMGTDASKDESLNELCDMVMHEILRPKFRKDQMPQNPLGVLWYKTRRFIYSVKFKGKVWNTSVLRTIWQTVLDHLRQPGTILARE